MTTPATDEPAPAYDLLIVGGGIVGAGVARDAAMRGLRTALVEQYDFAFGTSSRSSRLLHGGLRYLAQGRVMMVRQASREKAILARIAPHLAQPLPFLFPTRRGTPWSKWKLTLGVKLYDRMTAFAALAGSRGLSVDEVLAQVPQLNREGLTGAVWYHDALTNDARLVLDTLRAAAEHGACLANYLRFEDARRDGDLWVSSLRRQLTGEPLSLRSRCVVNCAGPWSDRLPHSRTKLRLTKGIHLVIRRERLPVEAAIVLTEGTRILFVIPWGERAILGTTDTDYDGPPATPGVGSEDIDYLLGVVNRHFPTLCLTADEALSSWSGLRPLVADRHGNPSDISRQHEILAGEPGWFDVTGGKLTTYRLMAEEAVDRLLPCLGREPRGCRTDQEPLLAEPGFSGILPPPFAEEVVRHACAHEWAVHLDDVMLRRTGWQHYLDQPAAKAEQVADWMAAALGWDRPRRDAELRRYRRLLGPQPWYEPTTDR